MFFIIFVSLIQKSFQSKEVKSKNDKGKKSFVCQQLVIITTLSILFGLGWGIGLFATQDIHTNKTVQDLFAALFVILTAFHGLFIFIMHCLHSKEVRYTWKQWVFIVTGKDISQFSSSTFSRKHKKRYDIGVANSGNNSLGKSSYDSDVYVTLRSYKQKPLSSPVDVLIVENREVEMESGALSETTITKSFPDDKNEKEELQRKENGTLSETTSTKSFPDDKNEKEELQRKEKGTLSETTFTKSFPDHDDKNKKEELQREEEEQN